MPNEYEEKFNRLLQLSINLLSADEKYYLVRKKGFAGQMELQERIAAKRNLASFVRDEKVRRKNMNQGKLF